jgi:hypothetical protein
MGRAPVAGTYTNRTQLPRACLLPPCQCAGIAESERRRHGRVPARPRSSSPPVGLSPPPGDLPVSGCLVCGGGTVGQKGGGTGGRGGCADRAAHTESCVPCALPVRVMCVCACVLPPARLDTRVGLGDYTSGGAIPSFLLSCARGARYVVPGVVELQKGQFFHNGHRTLRMPERSPGPQVIFACT